MLYNKLLFIMQIIVIIDSSFCKHTYIAKLVTFGVRSGIEVCNQNRLIIFYNFYSFCSHYIILLMIYAARCINGGKSDLNEDQASAHHFYLKMCEPCKNISRSDGDLTQTKTEEMSEVAKGGLVCILHEYIYLNIQIMRFVTHIYAMKALTTSRP